MMRAVLALLTSLAAVLAFPSDSSQRIVGGSLTTIDQYPQSAAVLATGNFSWYMHNCGSTILNNVAVLTAAHCHSRGVNTATYRVRVGSTFSSSGGVLHAVQQVINHPNYNDNTLDNDIAILRLASFITFSNVVQAGAIAGTNYNVADNQPVWIAGWGITEQSFFPSEQLRHVQVYSVNQEVCRQYYNSFAITDNMICAAVLDVDGEDACTGDSGGALLHNKVAVGVFSFRSWRGCGHLGSPSVYARVSRYTNWIVANAQ